MEYNLMHFQKTVHGKSIRTNRAGEEWKKVPGSLSVPSNVTRAGFIRLGAKRVIKS